MEEAQIKNMAKQRIDPVSSSIIRTLLYYDIFKHPLTKNEIYLNFPEIIEEEEFEIHLNNLITAGVIKFEEGFYFLSCESIIPRRKKGNELAEKYMNKARKMTKVIASFPFVRGVSLSGSLSKGYMDEKADIDYFIITHPGRVWLSRTMLAFFKKIFLLNSRKYFCINYFIDDQSLRIEEQNIYTATEVVTLIPTYNYGLYKEFIANNYWTQKFRPNFPIYQNGHMKEPHDPLFKRSIEQLLSGKAGKFLDELCFRLTISYWKKKFKDFNPADFRKCFKSTRHVSTHHPQNFQKKVLALYEEKIRDFENEKLIILQ